MLGAGSLRFKVHFFGFVHCILFVIFYSLGLYLLNFFRFRFSVSAETESFFRFRYRFRPKRKMVVSAIFSFGRNEKKPFGRTLEDSNHWSEIKPKAIHNPMSNVSVGPANLLNY